MQNDSPETMEMVDRAEGSSRKRPRLDDSDATGKPEDPIVMAEVLPIVKDELYYRADGDSVIRVENVLFKVCVPFDLCTLSYVQRNFLTGTSLFVGKGLVDIRQYVQHATRGLRLCTLLRRESAYIVRRS